jgi:BirA family transcriptional regulator, biotin operon repressor / biotin---[acetyl-CoA-carboxylase] ligase
MSEPLPQEFSAALESTRSRRGPFGVPIYFLTETASTNDDAARLAERGASEGTVVIAWTQSAGRGRFGRQWFSPPGAGLYVSVVCRTPAVAPLLTLAGGVAAAEGICAATGLPVHIKWPNDIVVEGGTPVRRRKLAGILAEASTGADGLQHVILGFGINLRSAAFPLEVSDRATSVETELGRAPESGRVLAETLAALNARVAQLAAGDSAAVLERWRELAPSARGTAVEWDTPAGTRSGTSAGIADDGALLVRVGGGIERIISGELRWA